MKEDARSGGRAAQEGAVQVSAHLCGMRECCLNACGGAAGEGRGKVY